MDRYLTDDEQRRMIAAAKLVNSPEAQRDYRMMQVLLLSGLRGTEFLLITRADVESGLKSGYLFIPREHRKGKRLDHQVYLTQPLREALKALLLMSGAAPMSAPLVPGRDGERPMTLRNLQQRVKHWAEEAGVFLPVSPHWFRHSRAMSLLRGSTSADPMGVVQRVLGHANRNSTAIYAGPTREDIEQDLDAIDGRGGRKPSLNAQRAAFVRRAG